MSAGCAEALLLQEQAIAALQQREVPRAVRLFAESGAALAEAARRGEPADLALAARLSEGVAAATALAVARRDELRDQLGLLLRSQKAATAYGTLAQRQRR